MTQIDLELLFALKRFNTPTIANALEICSGRSPLEGISLDAVVDFMPEMGPMVGYAVTAEYSARESSDDAMEKSLEFAEAVEAGPHPVIAVIRDLHSPSQIAGAPWGECFANICRALGAVGTITDGGIRDYQEMRDAGFHALARRLCPSHALGHIERVNVPVQVFGLHITPGDLIHADQHGFVTIPAHCISVLAETAAQLDRLEIKHIIGPARQAGFTVDRLRRGLKEFKEETAALRQNRPSNTGI